jgi:hypothetical protein
MSKKKTSEVRLLPPRLVPLGAEQERDAVAVLAELLLGVAVKGRGGVSGGGLDGGSGGAIDGVGSLQARTGKAPKAA